MSDKPEIQIDLSCLRITDKENTRPDNIIQKDGRYFLAIIRCEIDKFTTLCHRAEKDIADNSLSEEVSGKVRAAIGKAQLLVTKKFKQFEKLCIENIESSPGKKKPMSTDLEGFWDMVLLQVKEVHKMFENLDEMRKNNWVETTIEAQDKPDGKLSPLPRNKKSAHRKVSKNNNFVDEDKARKDARQRLNAHLRATKLQRNVENEQATGDVIQIGRATKA